MTAFYQQQVQTPSTPHIELQSDPVPNEPISPPPFDDFPYDDFDESRESFPSDRNNVDNAIDKKIEEFIQNKRSKTNPKICTICNKLFRTNYKLREHMQTHENNPNFICEFSECGKTFKSKIGLKEHSARHTGQFNFTCWGSKQNFGQFLQTANVLITLSATCYYFYGVYDYRPHNLCVLPLDDELFCNGDVGSPLIYKINNIEHLVGIVSYGAQNASSLGSSVVVTKISIFLDWIKLHTGI
ncbi:hypothetical protein PVAND_016569 [Polypedilum vanderplanki]|uniref:Uncharacterized protein n=1 Tax=Polypedilum vanderplanki TaxID=319348 RepID=A0A9J6BFY9_POLVA|nr:hypothetical protein PVAND_016569 [Polypedilum vanderplanki]